MSVTPQKRRRIVADMRQNLLGPRLTMSIGKPASSKTNGSRPPKLIWAGTVGYSIYVGSLWAHQVHGNRIFLIVAGGFLGIS